MSEQMFIPFYLDKQMWDLTKPMLFLSEVYLEQLSDIEKREWKHNVLNSYETVSDECVCAYIAPFVEKLICVLETELSELHHLNYSHDYWHRLLFAWLEKYCRLTYYQVKLFENIKEQYPTCSFSSYVYEGEDNYIWNENAVSTTEDQYFSRVARIGECFFELNVIKKQLVNKSGVIGIRQRENVVQKRSLLRKVFQKNLGIKILHRIFNQRSKRAVKALYTNSYLKGIDLLRMITKSYGEIRPMELACELKPGEIDVAFRQKLKKVLMDSIKCEFLWQKVSIAFLPEELSAVFIEWYMKMHEISMRFLKQYPNLRVIRGHNDFYHSHIITFCAFLAKEHYGVKLLGLQHGGNYGIVKNIEYLEKCEEDVFYGWGNWAEQRNNEYKRGPSGKLYQYISAKKSKEYILFVGTYIPTKIAEGSSRCNSRDGTRYIFWQLSFFKAVNRQIINSIAVRNYYVDGGWGLNEKLEKEIPGIYITNKKYKSMSQVNFSARDDDFVVALSHCSMMICDHLSTTWLEALAADKPLLMFYPEGYYLYEESELPYVKMMEEVGILVHSPEVAAETLNQISSNIDEWWNEPERKKVVAIIKDRYVSSEKDVAKWWVDELLSMAKE